MGTDRFIVRMKMENIYAVIAKDNETRLNTSNYELERPLSRWKNKKVIILLKDELGRKLTKFVTLRPKENNYLTHDGRDNKKGKDTRKCVIKQELKFESYKNWLEANQCKIRQTTYMKMILKRIL